MCRSVGRSVCLSVCACGIRALLAYMQKKVESKVKRERRFCGVVVGWFCTRNLCVLVVVLLVQNYMHANKRKKKKTVANRERIWMRERGLNLLFFA
jgi:hypothetical protein